jgi:hypothetical protein
MGVTPTCYNEDMASRDIFQLKVTLKEVRPAVWRRLQVSADITFARLHRILQDALGWTNSHLHQFDVRGVQIGMPDEDAHEPIIDERRVRLRELAQVRSRIVYTYDFGDGWTHEILVEKVLPAETGGGYPRCIAGKRACPPEDCGGPWGYARLLEALGDPEHDEHEQLKEWIGGSFDPDAFDLTATNALLHPVRRGAAHPPH